MVWPGRLRGALALTLALLTLAPGALAAPRPASARLRTAVTRPQVYRLPAPIRANAPAWVGTQGKLAFLGNQQEGEPPDLYLWDPRLRQMGRATDGPMLRHSLASAPDGRLAYVERGETPGELPLAEGYKSGPDHIIVYDYARGTKKVVFEGGWVQAGTLAWSRDGSRLAFLTQGADDSPALALLDSGKPLSVTKLPLPYQLEDLVGWMGDHEVMAQATSPTGQPVLLRVGKTGMTALPPGLAPRLSPDGKYLLTRASESLGVILRGAAGGGHTLHQTATVYAWGPGERVFVVVGADVLSLDLAGHVIKQYPNVTLPGVDTLAVSPDGRYAAMLAGHELTVLVL